MRIIRLRHIVSVAIATIITCGVEAQNLQESLTVEGRYKPDIISADRLSLLPAGISLQAPESAMTFDRSGVVASFAPDGLNMPATGWKSKKKYDTTRGYLDLWLGSWLNSSLSAGYSVMAKENIKLNVYLQHNSTSLWRAWEADEDNGVAYSADRRYRYDETVGANFSQCIRKAGMLDAQVRYHLGYFNYYGTNNTYVNDRKIQAPSQTLNDVYVKAGWIGTTIGKFGYSADVDVRHFAYRVLYIPELGLESEFASMFTPTGRFAREKGARETVINAKGEVSYSLLPSSELDLGVRYSGVINSVGNDVNRVEILPGYNKSGDSYKLHAGLNLAVVDNGLVTRVRVAPDVRFSVRKGITAVSAETGGGTKLRTLAWAHTMDYYSNPMWGCEQAAYSPIDAKLGIQMNPGGRWTAGIRGEWCATLDETLGGEYMLFMVCPYIAPMTYGRLHGFSLSVNGGYEFSKYIALNASGSWQPQKENRGVLNGFDRPEFTIEASASSNPMENLNVHLDYQLRAKRYLVEGNISRLNFGADYRINDRIGVGIQLDNLLNRHEEILPCQPTEGITVMGGVQMVF